MEDIEHLVHDESFLLGEARVVLQHVQGHRPLGGRRIKIDDILITLRRDIGEDIHNVRAMRVNKADAVALLDILNNHIFKQSRFASAGLTDGVKVAHPIFSADKNFGHRTAIMIEAE